MKEADRTIMPMMLMTWTRDDLQQARQSVQVRMKGGGLAIKGQGKAFLKSKR
jgi:hypothetical protein